MQQYREKNNKTFNSLQNSPFLLKEVCGVQKSNSVQLSEDDLQDTLVEIRFLALSWLDDFEKQSFEGKTVEELLTHERLK
jgi:hypothetical protein